MRAFSEKVKDLQIPLTLLQFPKIFFFQTHTQMVHYQRNLRLILFLILPIIGFLLGWSLSLKNSDTKTPSVTVEIKSGEDVIKTSPIKSILARQKKAEETDLSLFWEAWTQMEANFLNKDSLKTQDQIYGAIKGLINSLDDPYTVFLNPEESKKFDESISGEFEGIGAEIGKRDNQLIVIAPLKGSPAEASGIRAGDVIFKVDDEPTHGLSIEEAVTKIRGPKGEKVDLTILREGESEPLEISIVRDSIILKNVEWEMRDGIAVVELSQFGTDVVKEFQEFIVEALLEKPEGMVIDLRNDGGGLLDACVKIASEFLDTKLIVQTKGRKFGDSGEIMSGDKGAFLDIPLVVLVNKGSASASEIFAGAIQDHNRGIVLGETTFGKGSVQNVIPLSDGSSLKVTIAEWLTPLGRSINETGIDPDEFIERTSEDFENEEDPVLDRALEILRNNEIPTLLEKKNKEEIVIEQEVEKVLEAEEE